MVEARLYRREIQKGMQRVDGEIKLEVDLQLIHISLLQVCTSRQIEKRCRRLAGFRAPGRDRYREIRSKLRNT